MIGITITVDVTKIDKARIFEGKKGKYVNFTSFFNPKEVNQFGYNGVVTQATTPEERQEGVSLPILGNVKVFYTKKENLQNEPLPDTKTQNFDDIPF